MSKDKDKTAVFEDKVDFPNVGKIDRALLQTMMLDKEERQIDSMAEYVRAALKHFPQCKEDETSQAMKPIITKYPGHCIKCKHEIEVNSWALFGQGVGLICMDCFVLKLGDKTILVKYLKNRELDRVAKALKEECDRLAGKVETLQVLNRLDDLTTQQRTITELVREFLTNKIGSPEEKKALEEFLRELDNGKRIIMDMDEFIKNYVRNRKWRKQILKEETEEAT
jgi:hypothetical protein